MAFSREIVLAIAILCATVLILGVLTLFVFNGSVSIDAGDLPEPGFVGTANFGDWELNCVPRAEMAPPPISFDRPDSSSDSNPGGDSSIESACRLRHEVLARAGENGEPSHVILAVHLSLVGPSMSPALMLRLPATLTEGDMVVLRTRDDFAVETLARDCSAEECVAASTLSEEEWDQIVGAESLQVVFRVDGVQLVSVDVSTEGLREAPCGPPSCASAGATETRTTNSGTVIDIGALTHVPCVHCVLLDLRPRKSIVSPVNMMSGDIS